MKKYDVIVVGSGPSGSTAARQLAKNNLKVLLLEKYKIPRAKPCAAGLPYHIDEILDFPIDNIVNKISDNTIFTFNHKKNVVLKHPDVKIKMTMREDFDTYLIEKSIEAGVKFKDNIIVKGLTEYKDYVEIITDKEKYISQYVIGADGALSSVAKYCGLLKDRKMGWALNAEVYVSDKQLKKQNSSVSVDLGCIPSGYAWIFPKKGHLSCGIGTNLSKLTNMKDLLYEYLNNCPSTKNYNRIEIKGHALPISYGQKLCINTERIVLTGDAASLVEPLSGEGIYYAIESAVIASKHICYSIQSNGQLSFYTEEINNTLRKELFYASKFANLLNQYPKLCYNIGVSNKLVNKKFMNLLIGKSSYEKMYHELKPLYTGKFLIKPINKTMDFINKIKNKIKSK